MIRPNTIDEYITGYPENIQVMLKKFRSTIRKAAPKAQEKIGYGIPTYLGGWKPGSFCSLQKSYWLLSCSVRKTQLATII